MNSKLTTLGEIVERRRIELGLSQKELGARISRDASEVSRIENGRADPKASDLLLLAVALETTVTELLDEDRELVAKRAAEVIDDPMTLSYFIRLGGGIRRARPKDREFLERMLKSLADAADPPEGHEAGTPGDLAQLAEQNGPSR